MENEVLAIVPKLSGHQVSEINARKFKKDEEEEEKLKLFNGKITAFITHPDGVYTV